MATDSRILKVIEQGPDLMALTKNKYNLQVAKSVIANGQLTFNIIWQSRVLAPSISLQWKPTYGLNWTASVPDPGLVISLSGFWKQCDEGQVLDLNSSGLFVQSTASTKPGYLKVGSNNYQTQSGDNGVHFIVGIQEASGNFSPIFVDPTETGHGMEAAYQPQEKVQWWYQAGMQTSSMISENRGPTETGDFSKPDDVTGLYSKSSSYDFKKGEWTTTSP